MTRQNNKRAGIRLRRMCLVALVASTSWVSLDDGGVHASRRTQSAVIADEASRAVDALDRWNATKNPIDYVRFMQRRDLTASLIETDVESEAGSLSTRWAAVPVTKQHAVLNAVSQLGVPYKSISSEPGVGFDCSGLTTWAFGEAGIELPRVSGDQINAATSIERDDAEPGDLVYYPGHVSIFVGDGLMVHARSTGSHVEIASLSDRSLRFGDTVESLAATDT